MAFSYLFISLIITAVSANNDWSLPCFSGVCEYDLPSSNGTASGTLKIWGPESSIGDITPAAGWSIVDCSPDALQQDVRLVCQDGSSTNCARLYSNSTNSDDAVGKVVRLPESCGKSAFAVVTKAWVPQDQSLPANLARSLARRDGTPPKVQALHLDTSFASVTPPSSGPVNFAIRAANVPGANGDITVSPQQRRSRIYSRGLFSFVGDAIDKISSLDSFDVSKSKTLPPIDADKTVNLVDKSISCAPVTASVKVDATAKAHAVVSIGVAASGTIIPPKIDDFALISSMSATLDGSIDMKASVGGTLDSGKLPLFEVGIPGLDFAGILSIGPSFEINGQATASLDLDVDMTVGVNYNINKASFTFPPKNGKASGAFNLGDTPLKLTASPSASATGTISAHLIPTVNFGISALGDEVAAKVFVDLDASASMTLGVQASAEASKQIRRSDSPRVVSSRFFKDLASREPQDDIFAADDGSEGAAVAPSLAPTSIIPLPGKPLSVAPSPSATKAIPLPGKPISVAPSSSTAKAIPLPGKPLSVAPLSGGKGPASSSTAALTLPGKAVSTATPSEAKSAAAKPAVSVSPVSFGGCFEVDAALDVNAGADGDFFGLFNENTQVALFSKKFELFKKCFGSNAAKRSIFTNVSRFVVKPSQQRSSLESRSIEKRAFNLKCLASKETEAKPTSLVDQIVSAASISK